MKNSEEIEVPKVSIERDPMLLTGFVALSALLIAFDYLLFRAVNPWGFIVMIPASIVSFQTLWLLLRPFAMIFDNRFEIRHSLFSNKLHHFVDIKKLSETNSGKLYITYTDDEIERLNLFGIKKAHIPLLKEQIEKHITPKG